MSLRSASRLILLSLAFGGLARPAFAQGGGLVGSFEAGMRWIYGADLSSAWIPHALAFGARGDLVWVATGGDHHRLMLLAGPGAGIVAPIYEDPALEASEGIVAVATGNGGERLFSLAQYPEPDLFHRRTVVARHSALQLGGGSTFSAAWSTQFPFVGNGPALFATDRAGERLVAAAFNNQSGRVVVRWLEGTTGHCTQSLVLAGTGLEALALAADGNRTALSIGARLVILGPGASIVHDEVLGTAALSMAFSADGSRLIVGLLGALRTYDQAATGYVQSHVTLGAGNQVASRVAIAPDGSTHAAAWWTFRAVDELCFEVYDGASHNVINRVLQAGFPGSPQNSPSAVEFSADGSRVVFAAWGRGDRAPEVVLLSPGEARPLLEIDLPGSAMGAALDVRGRRVAVLTKSLHANQFGSTGEVRLYSTGEADVELLAPARMGQALEVASCQRGSSLALFLVGQRGPVATHPAGTLGSLWLVRNERMEIVARPVDGQGRADLSLPIPAAAAWLGAPLSVQVVHRVGAVLRFSETVLDPLFY